MADRLRYALALAKRGLPVFPLERNGKRPAHSCWQHEASTAPILKWWNGSQPPFNIGIHCAGLVVVDIDNKAVRGSDTWAELEELHGGAGPTFTVETPTGGFHLYFRGPDVPLSAGKLGPGLDIRSKGGYVVGPGSKIDGRPYVVVDKSDIAEAPEWLIRLCGQKKERDKNADVPAVEPDREDAVALAREYLKTAAPAIEGRGGDAHTYETACRVRDFGVSEPTALDLMLGYWNGRCSPPWHPDELAVKVSNAYRFAVNRQGEAHPAATFADAPVPDVAAQDEALFGKPPAPLEAARVEPFEPAAIPPRKWLIDTLAIEGFVSLLIADPGAGKSSFALAVALAVATGRTDLIDVPVAGRKLMQVRRVAPVWVYNNEDDPDELRRRIAALMSRHQIKWEDIDGRLYINSGATGRPLCIARAGERGTVYEADGPELVEQIKRHGIKMLVADPLAEMHEGDENDNRAMNKVGRLFRDVATASGAAALLIHHTNKPPQAGAEGRDGNMYAARGASALVGVARLVKTMFTMGATDAALYGVGPDKRHHYARITDAKANVYLATDAPRWYERAGERLPTDETVGVLIPVDLQRQADEKGAQLRLDVARLFPQVGGEYTVKRVAADLASSYPMYAGTAPKDLERRVVEAVGEGYAAADLSVAIRRARGRAPSLVASPEPAPEGEQEQQQGPADDDGGPDSKHN